jgi:hypothetical protein
MQKSLGFTIAAVLIVFLSAPSEAKKRPTVDSSDVCWNGGSSDKGCEGLICYCCYDEGCWICNKDTYDCVWDGSYRAGSKPGAPIVIPPRSSISPPWAQPPKGEEPKGKE